MASKDNTKRYLVIGAAITAGAAALYLAYKYVFGRRRLDIAAIDFSKSHNLTREQIDGLWAEYDRDGNGYLDKHELKLLVDALLKRLHQERAFTQNFVHHMFDDKTEKTVKEDAHNLMRGMTKDLKDESHSVAAELLNRLDANRDGKVSKEEFTSLFNMWFEHKVHTELTDFFTH
jgi:Ca2+-binding EF-hand superfamily protein